MTPKHTMLNTPDQTTLNEEKRDMVLRDLLSSRAILAGFVFFVLIVGGTQLYSWYVLRTSTTDLEPTKQTPQVPENKNEMRTKQRVNSPTGTETSGYLLETIEENMDPRNATDNGGLEDTNTRKTQAPLTEHPPETTTTGVRVSPFGFGPYPEVPEDFPYPPPWDVPSIRQYDEHVHVQHELICRIAIKLWTQGIQTLGGVFGDDGLFYPNIEGTVYVKWGYRGAHDNLRYPSELGGDPQAGRRLVQISREKRERRESFSDADIPADITVLTFEEGGIDPYTFLDLSR